MRLILTMLLLQLVLGATIATAQPTLIERHIGADREEATKKPRSERDQAVVDGWPLYRNERGQAAFNAAMATLKATDGMVPAAQAFQGCADLDCNLTLPKLSSDGWLPPGRLWVGPREYVLVVHSARQREGRGWNRRSARGMKYFVFHEFHNSSRNTDVFDTAASHKGAVFVPFYMSKSLVDAKGRRFVVVLQTAPHDVVSIHATNMGSAGPGIEVAKNAADETERLQNLAGILVAAIVTSAVPRLEVVNHQGSEGRAMLEAYDNRVERLSGRRNGLRMTLPFVAATADRIVAARGKLEELIAMPGVEPRVPVAERTFLPPRPATANRGAEPKLIGPVQLATRPPPLRGTTVEK